MNNFKLPLKKPMLQLYMWGNEQKPCWIITTMIPREWKVCLFSSQFYFMKKTDWKFREITHKKHFGEKLYNIGLTSPIFFTIFFCNFTIFFLSRFFSVLFTNFQLFVYFFQILPTESRVDGSNWLPGQKNAIN